MFNSQSSIRCELSQNQTASSGWSKYTWHSSQIIKKYVRLNYYLSSTRYRIIESHTWPLTQKGAAPHSHYDQDKIYKHTISIANNIANLRFSCPGWHYVLSLNNNISLPMPFLYSIVRSQFTDLSVFLKKPELSSARL